jgi:hypothetical protein
VLKKIIKGEDPEEEINLKGICEVNLSYNKFDDVCTKEICQYLKFNGWTRSLNLKGNVI